MSWPSLVRRLLRKLDKTIAGWFFIDQWVILTAHDLSYKGLRWDALHPLVPPKDRYWGDPFVLRRDDCYFVFIEEKLYSSGLGRIACLKLDQSGALLSQQVVLERPYHLSYPFVFEHGGELYMLPETAANRTLELYHCTRFPDRWELARTLMSDIYAVDATLLEHEGKFWLFANVKIPGGSSLDALYLYYSTDLLRGEWHAHPANPVVKDIRWARPAGRIIQDGSRLIRPGQDSSRRYGYALQFRRITALDTSRYAEESETGFTPRGSRYLATHTFNSDGGLTVVDAVLRRRK